MKKYLTFLLTPILTCLFLTSCATTISTDPNGATTQVTVITPVALNLIEVGSSVAAGGVLNFAITDSTERIKVANQMYSAANAIYSLSTGTLPTVDQFKQTILAFGGSDKDANYATFTSSLTSLYSNYYTQYNKGNISNANQILASLAKGIQDATQSYVIVTPIS